MANHIDDTDKLEAIIYATASKFLNESDLNQIPLRRKTSRNLRRSYGVEKRVVFMNMRIIKGAVALTNKSSREAAASFLLFSFLKHRKTNDLF